MQPYFSVIIPVYNGGSRIVPTLDSVCKQTFPDFEIIVVDDGSTDNTSENILLYCERIPSKIHYICKRNGGVSSARNLGIVKASGKFVTFLDSDDFLEENYLQRMYETLDETAYGWACCVNKENGKINWNKFTYSGGELLQYILKGGALPQTACWTIDRLLLLSSRISFNESINYTEDYNFFCKFLYFAKGANIQGVYLKEPLVNYIIHNGSLCQWERLWLDVKHLEDDFNSTKDIYQVVQRRSIENQSLYSNLLLKRLKKKYLYNLWGTLLLGKMTDFKYLRHLYAEDKKIYSLSMVKLGLKYSIWEWATRPIICYMALVLRPYKRFQKSRQRKNIL